MVPSFSTVRWGFVYRDTSARSVRGKDPESSWSFKMGCSGLDGAGGLEAGDGDGGGFGGPTTWSITGFLGALAPAPGLALDCCFEVASRGVSSVPTLRTDPDDSRRRCPLPGRPGLRDRNRRGRDTSALVSGEGVGDRDGGLVAEGDAAM